MNGLRLFQRDWGGRDRIVRSAGCEEGGPAESEQRTRFRHGQRCSDQILAFVHGLGVSVRCARSPEAWNQHDRGTTRARRNNRRQAVSSAALPRTASIETSAAAAALNHTKRVSVSTMPPSTALRRARRGSGWLWLRAVTTTITAAAPQAYIAKPFAAASMNGPRARPSWVVSEVSRM